MNKKSCLAAILAMTLLVACKKDKNNEPSGSKETKISTIELASVASAAVYGSDITFKVKFDELAVEDKAVDQYGILFIAWISDVSNKTPVNGNATIILFPGAPAKGTVIEKKETLTYEQFNDANYRAFARLKDGTYIYGEVKYFGKS
ncbi:MAG: hypothetical protein KF746_00095 [Chitinophagaceae bacterium]|nr:hypothetical protein [Chitinophagaceae bacterium]